MNVETLKKMLEQITVEKNEYKCKCIIQEREIHKLKSEIQELKNENLRLINNSKIHKLKNERGAGRKQKFNDNDIEVIKMYRLQGKTIKEIADIFDCSVGLIHKIVKTL